MSTFQIGDNVKHTILNETGKILKTRNNTQGFDYLVEWFFPNNGVYPQDWFKADVLEKI